MSNNLFPPMPATDHAQGKHPRNDYLACPVCERVRWEAHVQASTK